MWPQLGLELWMVGVLLSANRFVRLATNPLAGRVVARHGVRGPFLAAVFLSAGATAAYGLDAGFAVFLAGRVLWGLCWSFLRLGGLLAALAAADARSRGALLGFVSGVTNLGTLVAVLCGGVLTDRVGFGPTVALFALLPCVAGLTLLRERPAPHEESGPQPAAGVRAATPEDPRARRRSRALHGAAFVNAGAGSGLVLATLGLQLVELEGAKVEIGSLVLGVASVNGALLALRFLVLVVWAPVTGHLSDRYGRLHLLRVSGLAVAAGLAGLSFDQGLAGTTALSVAVFVGGTSLRVALDATAGDEAPPAARARLLSVYANASDLGAAVGPFAAYALVDLVGLAWVYRGAAVLLLATGLFVLPTLRRGPRS